MIVSVLLAAMDLMVGACSEGTLYIEHNSWGLHKA